MCSSDLFIKEFPGGFDALGVFPYSPEPGTPAGTMYAKGGAIPDDVVQARLDELMLTQQEVVFARNKAMSESKQVFDVLIDTATSTKGRATTGVTKSGKLYTGRTTQQAPQIDGVTFVHSRHKLSPGEVVRCQIVDSDG